MAKKTVKQRGKNKGNTAVEYLVKYLGWPDRYNRWYRAEQREMLKSWWKSLKIAIHRMNM